MEVAQVGVLAGAGNGPVRTTVPVGIFDVPIGPQPSGQRAIRFLT